MGNKNCRGLVYRQLVSTFLSIFFSRNTSEPSGTHSLAQAFHYRFHLSVAAEGEGDDDLPEIADDWLTDEFRLKQLKVRPHFQVLSIAIIKL